MKPSRRSADGCGLTSILTSWRQRSSAGGQFPDLAATFYRDGIARTAAALSNWLRVQVRRGLIDLDHVEEAAGMLIAMVASAPQRAAIYGGVKLPSAAQIKARVRRCVILFLRGCEARG